ncbi:MAG: phasin family protein [Rickettsiales bacterium]|nr:phasin family protein [Rickettsiales bacterium]
MAKVTKKKTSAARKTKKAASTAAKKSPKKVSAARSKVTRAKKATASTARAAKTAARAPRATVAAAAAAPAAPSTNDVMSFGTNVMRNFFDAASNIPAAKEAEQFMSFGKEGAAQVAKNADVASRSLNEIVSAGKGNMDTCVQCGNIAVDASKNLSAEMINYANQSFSRNVELSKELFGCRTLNDMFDLQSKVVKTNLDHFFNESVKMSEMAFKCASEVSEPLNERVTETAELINKTITEAA